MTYLEEQINSVNSPIYELYVGYMQYALNLTNSKYPNKTRAEVEAHNMTIDVIDSAFAGWMRPSKVTMSEAMDFIEREIVKEKQ